MAKKENSKTSDKEAKKSKKERDKKSGKNKLDLSLLATIDNIVFSKNEIWAYYRINNSVFDFLSTDAKTSLAIRTTNAFNSLMSEKNEKLDCHLIITSTPVDIDSWEEQVLEASKHWDKAPSFNSFIKQQVEFLKQEDFTRKVAYLGVKLGRRGALESDSFNVLEMGIKGSIDFIKEWSKKALQLPTEEIDAFEENDARTKEKQLFTTLSTGNLRASRMSSEEILLLIKRQFYPSMPTPYLDVDHDDRLGPGDLVLETHSVIKNKYRYLEIEQPFKNLILRGCRATLSFSSFPKFMSYPNGTIPFFYFPAKLALPFTMYARFSLTPSQEMKREVEKKKKEQLDEIKNLQEGRDPDEYLIDSTPADISDAMQDLQTISGVIASDKTPWLEGSYRIVVETPDEETLKKYVSILQQQYKDLDINLTWTSGDQAQLFLEQMPGDFLRMKSFQQVTNLQHIGTSGFNFASDVGDTIYGTDVEV